MILRKLHQLSIEVLPYLVYFPDLSPIDLQFSAYVTIYIYIYKRFVCKTTMRYWKYVFVHFPASTKYSDFYM